MGFIARNVIMLHANNKGVNHPVSLQLINAFIIHSCKTKKKLTFFESEKHSLFYIISILDLKA